MSEYIEIKAENIDQYLEIKAEIVDYLMQNYCEYPEEVISDFVDYYDAPESWALKLFDEIAEEFPELTAGDGLEF